MKENKFVLGLGGLFFRSKDPEALGDWYEKHFSINSMKSGYVWGQEAGPTVFSPFKQDTTYFGGPTQMFMVNFRVRDLEGFLVKLEEAQVKIDSERQNDEIGKFAWVYDPEGNKIELWEPAEEENHN